MTEEQQQFSDAELRALVEALSRGEGRDVGDAEVVPLVQWASQVRTDAAIVELLLDGRLIARRDPGQGFQFRMPRPGESPTL